MLIVMSKLIFYIKKNTLLIKITMMMPCEGGQKICAWCGCAKPVQCMCCRCSFCVQCCSCPPPCLPNVDPMPSLPCMPCMGPPPPPIRIVREQVMVPVPVPVPMCSSPTMPYCAPLPTMPCYSPMSTFPFCSSPPTYPFCSPMPSYPMCSPASGIVSSCSYQLPTASLCTPMTMPTCCRPPAGCPSSGPPRIRSPDCGGLGDFCGIPNVLPQECCYEVDPEIELFNPCPPAYPKRLYRPGCAIVPGYQGHVPGLKRHGAGRTHGNATKDTRCIMAQWGSCGDPKLPRRIFEQ